MSKYILIGSAVVIMVMSLTIWYLLKENKVLTQNNAKQEVALTIQRDSINKLELTRKLDQLKNDELSRLYNESTQDALEQKKILKRHNIDLLSINKRILIQNIINRGTKKVLENINRISKHE